MLSFEKMKDKDFLNINQRRVNEGLQAGYRQKLIDDILGGE